MNRKRIGSMLLATILAAVMLSGCVVVPARGFWYGDGGYRHGGPSHGYPHRGR
jgi:hypothetical protein